MAKERKIEGGVIVGLLECDLIDEPAKEEKAEPAEKKRAGRKKATD